MIQIPLTQGRVALIDDEDFEEISKWDWHFHPQNRDKNKGYAARGRCSPGKQRKFFMHSAIMKSESSIRVDHKNGNGLDNRKENLRFATSSQNACNAGRSKRNTTGFKGVSFFKAQKKFAARIKLHGKSVFLGYFESAEEAGQAYVDAAPGLHGEFARV